MSRDQMMSCSRSPSFFSSMAVRIAFYRGSVVGSGREEWMYAV